MTRTLQERTGHQGEALPSCRSLLRVRVSFLGCGESPLPIVTIGGFPRHELREIRRLPESIRDSISIGLETHEQALLDAWNAYS